MNKKYKIAGVVAVVLALILRLVIYFHHTTVAVFDPKGIIAAKERNLIFLALGLSLIVVIPVFTLLFAISYRYREGNKKARYSPNLDHNAIAETFWWLIPGAIILVLSIVAWNSSHTLDPSQPLIGKHPAITVQVIALDWKWLFLYPQQNIASVNLIEMPVDTPVNFEITSDSVMNSFWIPQLGGQIYAMPGMSTELHLMASSTGSFRGSSANISGRGFAGMAFTARATSQQGFQQWLQTARQAPQALSNGTYNQLVAPSENNPVAYYSSAPDALYNIVIEKYMAPISTGGDEIQSGPGLTYSPAGVSQ